MVKTVLSCSTLDHWVMSLVVVFNGSLVDWAGWCCLCCVERGARS